MLINYPMSIFVIKNLLLIIIAVAALILKKKLFNRLMQTAKERHKNLKLAFMQAFDKPISIMVIFTTISLLTQNLLLFFKLNITWLAPTTSAILLSTIAFGVNSFINQLEKQFAEDPTPHLLDITTIMALNRLFKIMIVIIVGLMIMQLYAIPISGILAFGGLSGIAVGFSGKNMLENFFGGIMLYTERPFLVGDCISSPDKDIEGTIEKIGLRATQIRRPDQMLMYVPNASFTSMTLINNSRRSNSRIYETIVLNHEDLPKLKLICNDITAMLKAHHDIDLNKTIQVNLTAITLHGLQCLIWCFTKSTTKEEHLNTLEDILSKAMVIITSHGATMPVPVSRVLLNQEA